MWFGEKERLTLEDGNCRGMPGYRGWGLGGVGRGGSEGSDNPPFLGANVIP